MLPDDVFREILQFLEWNDCGILGTVCKYICEVHRKYTTEIPGVDLDGIPFEILGRIAIGYPYITSAKLTSVTRFPRLPPWNLQKLSFLNLNPISTERIAEKYPNLTYLYIGSTNDITPLLGLSSLVTLRAVLLTRSPAFSLETLPNLRELTLTGQVPFGLWSRVENLISLDVGSNIINRVIEFPHLERLNCLSFCAGLVLPNLRVLSVIFADELRSLTANKLNKIFVNILPGETSHFSRFPELESLWINNTTVSTDILAADLPRLPLKRLSLTLPREGPPTEVSMRRIITIPTLTELEIFPTSTLHLFSLEFWRPNTLKHIRILNLANSNLPDSVLVSMEAIESLTIPGSLNITDYGVVTLLNRRGNKIRYICVTACSGLTHVSYEKITETCQLYHY